MGGEAANIRSPEVLKRFRHRLIEFGDQANLALETVEGDIRSVAEWLRREQLPGWEAEHRRRHDRMKAAWRDYISARESDLRLGKRSTVDERKAWEQAKRRLEEAEQKIRAIRHWSLTLERETSLLMAPCVRLRTILETEMPRGLARLDFLLDHLDDYFGSSAGAKP